ncbi:TRIM3 [Branchiostoma lanceolatum]|uniref:TRIM3 protein n=1 Tax=Branchiostoma lanceolatum TaxID=7740 RepID=A0A8K0AEL2_BRALA|nr:TRIM3 [Branchiostoma lanceolatum]
MSDADGRSKRESAVIAGNSSDDEKEDDPIEPYLVTYHLETVHSETPNTNSADNNIERTEDIISPHPEDEWWSDDDPDSNIEPYFTAYNLEILTTENPDPPTKNTSKSHTIDNPHDEEAHDIGKDEVSQDQTDHEYTYIPDTEDHKYTYIPDKEDHEYTFIPDTSTEDHVYTYTDETSVDGRQATAEDRGSRSVTSDRQDPSVRSRAEPLLQNPMYVSNNVPRQGNQGDTTATPDTYKTTFDVSVIPWAVAMSPLNETVVVSRNLSEVHVFDSQGVHLHQFTTLVKKGQELTIIHPQDVTFIHSWNNKAIWIVGGDMSSHYVLTYYNKGRHQVSFEIPRTSAPRRLALNRQHTRAIVTETDGRRGEVKMYGMNGMLDRRFGRRQGLVYPTGIAVDNEDHILVADYCTAYIYVYQDNGQFVFKFAGKGSYNGQLSFPLDICTDSSRHIIVADSGNRRVEVFTSRGEFIRHIATNVDPKSMAIGPAGQLVLIEKSSYKVTILMRY